MDDFGKILQDLVKNLPQDAAAPAKPAQDAQDALSAEGMAMPAMPELSSILGKLPPPMPMNNRKLQLLGCAEHTSETFQICNVKTAERYFFLIGNFQSFI